MTDEKSPGDRILDAVLFVPAGLALTVLEEFPRLAEKGRSRVESQVTTARVVGQFALQMGRGRLDKLVEGLFARSHAPSEPGPGPQVDSAPGHAQRSQARNAGSRAKARTGASVRVDEEVAAPSPPGVPRETAVGGVPGPEGQAPEPSGPVTVAAPSSGVPASNGHEGVSTLAIPGYDTLSASHVLQRLGGLSASELEELSRYEKAHRHRRTILNRVEQLLAELTALETRSAGARTAGARPTRRETPRRGVT